MSLFPLRRLVRPAGAVDRNHVYSSISSSGLRAVVIAVVTLLTFAGGRATAQNSLPVAAEMRLDRVQQSLTGTHRHYTQYINGVRVVGGERSETLLREGALRVNFDRTAAAPARSASAKAAVRAATDAVPESAEFVYLNIAGVARPAIRTIVLTRALEPHARYVDADSGALLRDDPLFYTVKARVFDVNPVAKLNAPSLRDQNDSAAAVPDAAYSDVDLDNLYASPVLVGPNAQIVDVELPFTPHADPSASLDFNRSQPQFEEVNAYFQIDRNQKYLQSLGYTGTRQLVAYAIPIDAHAANGTDNSYYIEGSAIGRGTLYFGDGGTDDAEDSDIMLHEFMHAIHDWIIPGTLTGSSSSQARAVSEGLGDYWSFSSTYAATTASGRDPFCIGEWDARCAGDDPSANCGYAEGADCLRRVDSRKTIADFVNSEAAGTEHENGEIWSSALREIFMTLTQRYGLATGKSAADTVVLESLFGLPPQPDFRTVAQSMVAADRQLRGGVDVDTICAAMTLRGILTAGDCGNLPRGEWTLIESGDQGIPIPDGSGSVISRIAVSDSRLIQRIAVRVDIAHPSRGDLAITLIAPSGTAVRLKESSQVDRTPDVHATFGVDAPSVDSLSMLQGQPANGVWQLQVSDVFSGDAGVLQSWALELVLAGDAPSTTRPTAAPSRLFIPAVAHAKGAAGYDYTSDVYVMNRGVRDATVTAIFTPTGGDGTANFAAVKLLIPRDETVVLRDIVRALFASTGIGSVELRSDSADLVATSVTSAATAAGSFAQAIDALSPSSAVGAGDPSLFVLPVITSANARTNVGLVETTGAPGVARLTIRRTDGTVVSTADLALPPFSHRQIPVAADNGWCVAELNVISGAARVLGYESLIDSQSGDATFFAAVPLSPSPMRVTLAGIGHAAGVGGSTWDTALWYAAPMTAAAGAQFTYRPAARPAIDRTVSAAAPLNILAAVPELFGMTGSTSGQLDIVLPAGGLVAARTYTPWRTASGTAGDRAIVASSAGTAIDALHIESNPAYRTNIGVVALDDVATRVHMTLFDAAGRQLAAVDQFLPPRGSMQQPISSIYAATLTNARVRLEADGGRIAAYASVVDNRTNDAVTIPGR